MTISEKGLDLIKQFEGFSASPYLDQALVPTIGYGTTHYIDRAVTMDDNHISEEMASKLLEGQVNDIYGKAVNTYVQVPIDQNQFDALTSFTYNVGVNAFKNSTLLKYINQGQDKLAANEFEKWSHINGKVSNGLLARRKLEKDLFLA